MSLYSEVVGQPVPIPQWLIRHDLRRCGERFHGHF